MPSSQKTTNLQLNKWVSGDKPKRQDFCDDNEIIDAALAEAIKGQTGKKLKIVSCVLRNTGSGWFAIDDGAAHSPINILSVTSDATKIRVNYDFTAQKVGSFLTTVDDSMAKEGYTCGSSVGLTYSDIYLSRLTGASGKASYNGTSWDIATGSEGMASASFSGGTLTITHDSIYNNNPAASCSCQDGYYLANIGATTATTTEVKIKNYSNALVATADTNMKIYFARHGKAIVDPSTYTNAAGNIWCLGVFEID